jgi:hypothetical protein
MKSGKALLSVAGFLAIALAGCTSEGGDGFTTKAPSAPGGEYVFTATGSADNYTWDLGDRLTVAYGKTVRHAYDFQNGQITVVLTQKTGDLRRDFRQTLTLGTGQNSLPTFILEGNTNWTVTGETITFSAAASTDPDGDPLRYTWSCVRTGDAVRQPAHVHAGFQGVPFATPPAGSVTALIATGPMPAPDRTVEGDMCETLGSGGRPSRDATIAGSFTRTGVYDIYLLASDPVHPTTSGKFHFVVTDPSERPNPVYTTTFENSLQGGTGNLQDILGEPTGETFDKATHSFALPLIGTGGNVTVTASYQVPGSELSWSLKRGTLVLAEGSGDGVAASLAGLDLKQATYSLEVSLTGGPTTYSVLVEIPLDMDPFKVY